MSNYSKKNISEYNEEDNVFKSEIYELVDGNIYPIFPFDKVNYSLNKYIVDNKIKIDYLEFEKLKAAQFTLDDYIKIENSENLLEKRLFCINNFKYICVNDFEPPITTISIDYLNYIYDNINIFFNMLKLDAEYCVMLVLRYGMLNANTQKNIIDKLYIDIEQLHTLSISVEELESKKRELEGLIILMQDKDLYGKELTLNECGEVYGVSRERIRQKAVTAERKLLNCMNNTVYGNYDEIFLFSFNKRFLNDVFYINDFIINNRKSFCKELEFNDSLLTKLDFFEIYGALWSEVEVQYYYKNDYVNINNEWVSRNKYELFRYFIEKILICPMNLEEIYDKYTLFLDKYILEERSNRKKELRAFGSLIERQKNIIKSNKHYRLHIIKNEDIFIEELKFLIDSMPRFFSTKKIFDENKELMEKFNIIDHYELHYFIRFNISNFSSNIDMERMPHISKGLSFEQYLTNYLDNSECQTLDGFLEDIMLGTGILPQTILANYGGVVDNYYLYNKRLKSSYMTPLDGYITSKYTLNIYSQDEVTDDLHLYGYNSFVENGFKLVRGWLVKGNSIKSCIFDQFDEFGLSDFSYVSEAVKTSDSLYTSLYYYRQALEVIKFNDTLYLKVSDELRKEIQELLNILHNHLLRNDYLTLGEFMLLAVEEKFPLINDYQFGEIFFTEILYSEKSIKLLYNVIYYEGTSPLGIINCIIEEREKISIWDLEHYLENKRNWKYNQKFIDRLKYENEYYYVKEIDSIFYDKKTFIKYLEEN